MASGVLDLLVDNDSLEGDLKGLTLRDLKTKIDT